MQFVGALLQPRLHLAQLIQPLLLGGGGQRDRRLFIRLGRGVELLRQLLDLLLEAQHFFVEGRLRRGVAGRALQNLARGHESELERTGRDRRPRGGGGGGGGGRGLGRRLRRARARQDHPDPTPHKRLRGNWHPTKLRSLKWHCQPRGGMPNCVPPMKKSWSKNGESPNTNPDRAERPSTKRMPPPTGPPLPPSWPSGAYQRPSRSRRWKSPLPPSRPPLWERPALAIEPAVGNGRSIPELRSDETPKVERRQFAHPKRARKAWLEAEPSNVCSSSAYEAKRRV